MGFLSILGKIAGAITGLGNVAGKDAEGAAKGQATQAQLQQGQDRNAIDLYQAQQAAQNQAANQDLQRQQFGTQNRSSTAKQALIGALLGGGVTPTSISGGQASGGLLRSLNGNPDALAALKLLGSQGSQAQNTPLSFQGGNAVAPPTLTPLPTPGKGSNLLSTFARIANLTGSAAPLFNPDLYKKNGGGDAPGQGGDWGGYG